MQPAPARLTHTQPSPAALQDAEEDKDVDMQAQHMLLREWALKEIGLDQVRALALHMQHCRQHDLQHAVEPALYA
jgi:hypothetical protein